MNLFLLLGRLRKKLLASQRFGHLPFVSIWTAAIVLVVYMIASASHMESEAAQIVIEVREILFPESN